jgi:hypothetical protein
MPPLDEIRSAFLRKPWKRVKNSSQEVIPPFAVMRVVSSAIIDGEVVVTVAKPNTTFISEYLVNGPWAIGSGSSDEGLATDLSESGLVLFGTGTPAVGEEWGPEPSQWYLKKYRYGFRIKGSTYTFGDYTAVVGKQFAVCNFIGKADGNISAGSSGTLDLYDGNQADMSMTQAVTNRTGLQIDDTKWAKGTYMGSTAFAEPWECPA